jgi:hypothetical protein
MQGGGVLTFRDFGASRRNRNDDEAEKIKEDLQLLCLLGSIPKWISAWMSFNARNYVIPVGGGKGAYYCLHYLKDHNMKNGNITLLSVQDDTKSYNKQKSIDKALKRAKKQQQSTAKCLEYCKQNGVRQFLQLILDMLAFVRDRQSDLHLCLPAGLQGGLGCDTHFGRKPVAVGNHCGHCLRLR